MRAQNKVKEEDNTMLIRPGWTGSLYQKRGYHEGNPSGVAYDQPPSERQPRTTRYVSVPSSRPTITELTH